MNHDNEKNPISYTMRVKGEIWKPDGDTQHLKRERPNDLIEPNIIQIYSPLCKIISGLKVGQKMALTGDLGREYPSEGLKIYGFAKGIKGGNTTKLKQGKEQ